MIRRLLPLVTKLRNLHRFPTRTALSEDTFEENWRLVVGATFTTGEFGLGRDEAAFAGSFEDSGAEAFEIGLNALERSNRRIQPRELYLDLINNPVLLQRSEPREMESAQLSPQRFP